MSVHWKYDAKNKGIVAYPQPNYEYFIEKERLPEKDWLFHLQEKTWFDRESERSFLKAKHECLKGAV